MNEGQDFDDNEELTLQPLRLEDDLGNNLDSPDIASSPLTETVWLSPTVESPEGLDNLDLRGNGLVASPKQLLQEEQQRLAYFGKCFI